MQKTLLSMVSAPSNNTLSKSPVVVFIIRCSVSGEEILCDSISLVDLVDPRSIRGRHLCQQHLQRLAGGADDHQPEDDFQTCERARLSLGDHLQGRAEPSGCERGAGKRKEGMGRRTEQRHRHKKKEEIFFRGI